MSPTNNRLDYLDAVRSFALIWGVIFHASLSFVPIFIGWAVMDVSTHDIAGLLAFVSHSFRMELFFLIAGFFSHMKFHQQGSRAFAKSRLVRIAIPFILGWLLLRPLLVSGWIMGAESMQGEVNIWAAIVNGYQSLGGGDYEWFAGSHLWFLYYLLLISASIIVLRYIVVSIKPVSCVVIKLADYAVARLAHSRFTVFLLAIPTSCCLWFMGSLGVDTPDKSLTPNIAVFVLYSGFFLFGWLLGRHTIHMEKFACLTWHKILLCLVAISVAVILSSFEAKSGHSQYLLIKACFMLSYAIMMWSLVSIILGICQRLCTRPSEKVRYIADASYWLYLIHLPFVIWLQIAFAELPYHWFVKLVSICVITFTTSIILYDAFVRSSFIGLMLNGKRQPRVLFKKSIKTQCELS